MFGRIYIERVQSRTEGGASTMEKDPKMDPNYYLTSVGYLGSFELKLINDLIIKMESEYNPCQNHTLKK